MGAIEDMILAKKSIQKLIPYVNGNHSSELINNHKRILKLDSNESSIAPSPRVIWSIMKYLQQGPLNLYPDVEATELTEALTQYTGQPQENLLSFNGSDHALETICRTFLALGDEVIFFHPTYDHFRVYAESCDAIVKPVSENLALSLVDKIAVMYSKKTKMVYLVNPNNPTGFLVDPTEIEEALIHYPHVLFLVDEAYYEFCDVTTASLVQKYNNLIVSRSFSKAFGLAALRCGYTMANPQLNQQILKIRIGKNVNAVAQVAAKAALEDLDHMRRYVSDVTLARDWIVNQLMEKNIAVRSTVANFILIKVLEPQKIIRHLESNLVYVRDRSKIPQMEGFLRLTISDFLKMKRFWKVFETIPQEWLCKETDQAASF